TGSPRQTLSVRRGLAMLLAAASFSGCRVRGRCGLTRFRRQGEYDTLLRRQRWPLRRDAVERLPRRCGGRGRGPQLLVAVVRPAQQEVAHELSRPPCYRLPA